MDLEEFRIHGKELVDYICTYHATLEQRRVIPNVIPGYLSSLLPSEPPVAPEKWLNIIKDVEKVIMPGITHWQHPRFHAYFPSGNSYPSMMGDMISDAIGCIGFSWAASPACTELEMIMLDWLAKMMNLPKVFMHSEGLGGGGVIQGSASDCILTVMLSARHKTIKEVKQRLPLKNRIENPDHSRNIEAAILTKLVGYCSTLAHACVEKAGMISFVKIRQLEVDDEFSMRGSVLEEAIERDKKLGLIPFFVTVTLGTTACCSFDNLEEISLVCHKYNVWLHIDAAYAGSSFICPEFQKYLKGIEYVDSMNFNTNKFLLVNFDCSILWVRRSDYITNSMIVDPVYLQHKHSSKAVDFRHWGVPLSRRFRSLKLWFTIRAYGVEGLQTYIRNHVKLASEFEALVRTNDRFEIVGKVILGLVCFRLKSNPYEYFFSKHELNSINQCLIRTINESGKLHMTPSVVKDKYILRFCVCGEHATSEDIKYAWNIIKTYADEILIAQNGFNQWKFSLSRNENNKDKKISSAAVKLVKSVFSPESIREHLLNKKIKSEFISRITQNFSEAEPPTMKSPSVNIMALNNKESDLEIDEEMLRKRRNDENKNDRYDDEIELDECEQEVFVCENDLGVGVNNQNALTQLRRQTLLKMISDPAAYNRQFFKSLCFCNDLNRDLFISPEGIKDNVSKTSPINHRSTFSISDYQSKADI